MSEKIVCQLDDNGYFVSTTIADESPLEPGVFLIPARCVDAPAPKEFPGQRVKWTGSDWAYEDIPQPEPEPPRPRPTEQEIKNSEARAYLFETDWYVTRFAETGIPIPDDVKAARQTARESVVG